MTKENTVQSETVQRGRPSRKENKTRVSRVPMSGSRLRMEIREEDMDSNFHYAWINDTKSNIYDAIRAGFDYVTTSEIPSWGTRDVDTANSVDSKVSLTVNRDGTVAYLMKQPMEFYEEDRAALDAMVDAKETSMKRTLNSGDDGQYGEVSIDRRR